jgi:hypothetical protein
MQESQVRRPTTESLAPIRSCAVLIALAFNASCSERATGSQGTADADVNPSHTNATDGGTLEGRESTNIPSVRSAESSVRTSEHASTSIDATTGPDVDSGAQGSTEPEVSANTHDDGSRDPSGMDGGISTASEDSTTTVVPGICAELPSAPIAFEPALSLDARTSVTRDFDFDLDGNVISGDSNGHLIRVDKHGTTETWVAGIGPIRGVKVLEDGSAVFTAEDGQGVYLGRALEGGAMFRLLAGLERASGVELGPDGLLYVAETNADRVLRVNPATGEFTVAAVGVYRPYRMAFAPSGSTMYVSSYEGKGIYKVTFGAVSGLGEVSIFASSPAEPLPTPSAPCVNKRVGDDCSLPDGAGECVSVGSVVDCFRPDPCAELSNGSSCVYHQTGICAAGVCVDSCTGQDEGDDCSVNEELGSCVVSPWSGSLACQVVPSCQGKSAGDECVTSDGAPGICDSTKLCRERTQCDDLGAGAECTDWFDLPGLCTDSGVCDSNPCSLLEPGDPCIDPYLGSTGTCEDYNGVAWCVLQDPCEGRAPGEACVDGEREGTCEADMFGTLVCWKPACDGALEGDACLTSSYESGECEPNGNTLSCVLPAACAGAEEGDVCFNVGVGNVRTEGECGAEDGGMICRPAQPCANAAVGETCRTFQDQGQCVEGEDGLECQVLCSGLDLGDACETEGAAGKCRLSESGLGLICTILAPCEEARQGTTCTGDSGPGLCLEHGNMTPEGRCKPFECDGQVDGTLCALPTGAMGECASEQCLPSPGDVYGLGVDICGNVYSTDMNSGNLWQISPEGEFEFLALLPGSSYRSLQWGRNVGGFSRDVAYVRDWDGQAIYGVELGVPEAANNP